MFNTEPVRNDAIEAPRPDPAPARPQPGPAPVLARLTDPLWLIRALWQRKWLVVVGALAGALLAALASLFVAPKYTSYAQVFIDPRDLRVLQNEVSPNAMGGDPTSITAYLESQARIIASDSIKLRIVQQEGLDKDPEFGGEAAASGLGALFAALLPGSGGGAQRDGTLWALAALDKNVTVRRGERTFVIDIAVSSRDPMKAARLANAFANTYLDDQAAVRAEAAQRATAALTGRLDELRNRLRTAEEKAERYKEANGMVGAGGRLVSEEQLALNNAQLVAMRTKVTEARAKFDQSQRVSADTIASGDAPEAVASNTMTALRSQLGAALAREADLVATVGARHPSLAAAQAQVRDARRQIADELARIRRSAKVELDRAIEAEREVSRRVEDLKKTQVATGLAAVQLRELEREVESSRVVYDAFLRRARETGELAGIDTTNARVIGQAMPALQRSNTSRRTMTTMGAVAGAGAGAATAIALALFAPAFMPRRRKDAEGAAETTDAAPAPRADLPVARPIPVEPRQRPAEAAETPAPEAPATPPRNWRQLVAIPGGRKRDPQGLAGLGAPLLGSLPAVRHRRWRREIEATSVFQGPAHLVDVLDKPRGAFAGAVRTIRETLATQAEGRPRRILVLPLTPHAGATTLALNLALDSALAGEPALLIDAGLGELALSPVFAPQAELGLADVATGEAGLVRAALQDEGSGLFFLPRLPGADRLGLPQLTNGLFRAARRFGPVIIDGTTPPGDPLCARFAQAADDIVLVLREGDVGSSTLEAVLHALGEDAGKLRGFIVNAA